MSAQGVSADEAVDGLGAGVAWTYANVAVLAAANLFLVGFAIRTLGVSHYGVFAIIQSLALLLYVVDFGLGLGVVRSAALFRSGSDPGAREQARVDIEASHQVYGSLGLLVAGVAVVGALAIELVKHDHAAALTFLFVVLAAALDLALAALEGLTTGFRAFGALARASIAGTVASTVITVAFLNRWGLPVLGVGQLVGVVVTRAWLVRWTRANARWLRTRFRRPGRAATRRVLAFAFPLVVINAGTQLINSVNLVLIGVVVSSAGAGVYRAASALPSQAVSVLFRGVDAAFPGLVSVTEAREQERLNGLLTRISCFVSGVTLGGVALAREPIARALIGHPSPLAARIIAIFCAVWLVNVPIHGLVLLVVARGQQRLFVTLTAMEAVVNLPLTVALSLWDGAQGAALASLATIVLSNAVVLPFLLRSLGIGDVFRVVTVDGLGRTALGVATSAVAALLVSHHGHSLAAAIVMLAVAVGLAIPVGSVAIGSAGRGLLVRAVRAHPRTA